MWIYMCRLYLALKEEASIDIRLPCVAAWYVSEGTPGDAHLGATPLFVPLLCAGFFFFIFFLLLCCDGTMLCLHFLIRRWRRCANLCLHNTRRLIGAWDRYIQYKKGLTWGLRAPDTRFYRFSLRVSSILSFLSLCCWLFCSRVLRVCGV